MENESLRRLVWDEMLTATMRANYFGELVFHYQSLEKWFTVSIAVASSGSVATVLAPAPQWAKIAVPAISAAASFWLVFSQYGLLARDAADLYAGWNSLSKEYEEIWNHLADPQAEARFHQIFERGDPLSRAGTKFPNDAKRLGYWLDHAAALANARYAA